jgi:hypothetical protein
MQTKIEKDVRFLKIYAVIATLFCGVLLLTAFQNSDKKKFKEIDVERINIVEADGKLDLVISNKARQHPGIVDGKMLDRVGQRAPGILFFDHVGDEAGGLIVAENGGKGHALSFTFDKTRNDQTLALQHFESDNGQYWAGFRIYERPHGVSLHETNNKVKEIEKIKDETAKKAAYQKLKDAGEFGADRMVLGRGRNESAFINLMDRSGQPRIEIFVDADGDPKLNFLDESGRVIQSFPDAEKK